MHTKIQATARITGLIILFGFGFIFLGGFECDTPTSPRGAFSLEQHEWENPVALIQGESTVLAIVLNRVNRFSEDVTLAPTGDAPDNVTITFAPNPVINFDTHCACTITVDGDAEVGDHTFHILGTSTSRRDSLQCTLRVVAPGKPWTLITSGTSQTLHDINFADAMTAYAVGEAGAIVKTSDGGESFTSLTSGTGSNLNGVHFTHPDTGFAVGDAGTILHTTDGGANWSARSGTTHKLNDVHFSNSQDGYAAGVSGTVVASHDGGETWTEQAAPTTLDLTSIWSLDSQHSLVASIGGSLWNRESDQYYWEEWEYFDNTITDIFYSDDGWGFYVGARSSLEQYGNRTIILRTSSELHTWEPIPAENLFTLRGVAFADGSVGVVVGDNGTIFSTANGGDVWVYDDYAASHNIHDVDWFPGQRPLAVGQSGLVLRRDE